MSIDALMSRLRELNIKLWVENEQLKIRASKGVLTEDLARELSARKPEILRYLKQAETLAAGTPDRIEPLPRTGDIPLSFGQKRLWFLDRLEGPSATYNMPLAVRLDGDLDTDALRRALSEIVRRHEILRTNITIDQDQPVIRIREPEPCPLDLVDAEQADLPTWVERAAQRRFDLAHDPLLHATLVRLGASSHLFLVTMHHIVSDGWSLGVFIRELTTLYQAFREGQDSPLPPLAIQYADYAHWQRGRLQGEHLAGLLRYWQEQLTGAPEVLDLPTDRPRPPIQTYHGHSLSCPLGAELAQGVRALGQTAGTTLFMTLLAGFAALLARYSGQTDIVIGTAVANRNHPDIEPLIGLFINTLALRVDLSGEPTVLALLERVRAVCVGAYQHQDLPFEHVVEELKPPRSLSHSPLFQVSFDLQNAALDRVDMAGLVLSQVEQDAIAAKFDLGLAVEDTGTDLVAVWTYNPDLFDATTIQRLLSHYRNLLAGMVADAKQRLSALPLLAADEYRHILHATNATASAYPETQVFPELFAAQAEAYPDRIALVFGEQSLSYRHLRQRAGKLAAALTALGVGPETLVAICVERSPDLVVGLLGILGAGAAYIPLDPAYPKERLAAVLDDARPRVLLTQTRLQAQLPATTAHILCLDSPWEVAQHPPRCPARPDHAAYVIYTSGSTGRPKGVAISHRALLNFLWSMRQEPGLNAGDVLLAVTTVSFDIAALEIHLPLLTGARLILADRETALDGRRLQEAMHTHGVTHLQATPATWRLLLATGWQPTPPFTALCGGEALPTDLARRLLALGVTLWNMYGPTETTVWSAVRKVVAREAAEDSVETIGHPIANTQIHILDRQHRPQPIGVPGELYIGGDGLARGYLQRPELTAAAYVPNPHADSPGARLYRTGDLARRLANGDLEFLGRLDHQVKIRGYRIELGDIEASLRRQPDLREAVVMAREDTPGDKRLVAYLVATCDPPPTVENLRAQLRASLPEFMIPAAFVFLDTLPLTPNGKVNRKALPAPTRSKPETRLAAPRSVLETTIAAIWRQVLRVDEVGIDDNFFDLGGHSLLATQVHEALRPHLAEPFPLVALFQHPTIRSLATHLAGDAVSAPLAVQTPTPLNDAIAVIGLAGRFPGADDLDTFWANLCLGQESIQRFTDEQLLAAGLEPELIAQPNYVRANGCLSDVTGFDAGFFGITPAEAEVMDPQHRLFLECAWHALEHAGYGDSRGADIGVFAGCSHNGYLFRNILPRLYESGPQAIYQAIFLSDKDFLPLRVSYALNLRGPSLSIQTACSTSLVAVHTACQSLLAGECTLALAGGVGLKIPQHSGYLHEEGMIVSPDGHCRAFDAEAKGTVWGSGLGVVLLKPLAAALADRDTIHAVIKGSAVNNDGAMKIGFTAPGTDGQAAVIAAAQARAGIAPDSIGYVETHGTGTVLGDPIEVAALTRAFRVGTERRGFCALGSVKPNIGHLDTASGMAGLIKTILALQHRQLPPMAHFQRPNPEIDFEHSPFFVNDRLRDWPEGDTPRRAGVSSFGIGGTNAHVIVEEAPLREVPPESRPWRLLVLSARSPAALEQMREQLAQHLERHPDLALSDVAHTLALGRRRFDQRSAVVCRDRTDAISALRAVERVRLGQVPRNQTRRVAFLFPGQGAQQLFMGRELYRTEPVFRAQFDACADKLRASLGLDLRAALYPDTDDHEAAATRLDQTWLTQPALFAIEYALAQLWLSWGVQPAAMIGHSLGEYVAACLAGVFDLDTALNLVAERGRLIYAQAPGAMLAVSLTAAELPAWLNDELSLAAINAPESCVVSGPFAAVDDLAARLATADIPCRRLRTSHAFHSAMLDTAAQDFAAVLAHTELKTPNLPFISNLTGTWIQAEQATDPAYWAEHLRRTVRFEAGIGTLLADPDLLLLEVGPGTILSNLARRHPAATGRAVFASLGRTDSGESDLASLLDTLGRLWTLGVAIDWRGVYAHERLYRVPLPGYAFEHERYWIAPTTPTMSMRSESRPTRQALERWFYLPTWKPTLIPRPVATGDGAGLSWLVFGDDSALCRELLARLADLGVEVVTVSLSDSFQRRDTGYALRPGSPQDYAALFRELGPLHTVLHLWNLTAEPAAADWHSFEQVQDTGYYSLLCLSQALATRPHPVTLAVVASGLYDVNGMDTPRPELATLLGPCLVLPQEFPHIACRCLDMAALPNLADTLLAELFTAPHDPQVAYRHGRRLVPDFEQVTLAADATPRLRQHGVYLITGGLGNVGLLFARFLAETVQARLVLIGSSPFPPRAEWDAWLGDHADSDATSRKLRQLLELETLGAEVLVLRADVADIDAMRTALDRAESRFGALHGVIHAAGRLQDASFVTPFMDTSRDTSAAQFAPKIRGTYVLEQILAGRQLDIRVLISSTAAVLGGLGFTAYSAANRFLDAFAASRSATTPWLAINWDAWHFDPQASPEEFAMSPEDSVEAFRRILAQTGTGHMMVAVGDLPARWRQWVRRETPPAPANTVQHARPALVTVYAPPRDDTETRLAALWRELLGFDQVGIHDDFFELGGDSLLAIRLMNSLREQFGKQPPLSLLLSQPTIHQLATSLRDPLETSAFSPLVPIQTEGHLPPLFCVPGTGGHVLYFHELARCLRDYGRPFYGFQALGIDGRTPPLNRIEDIAALNIQALRDIQPEGPYYLAGHSFGGWVAFEMARQLRQQGHEVAWVVILDTGAPWERDLSAQGGWDDSRWLATVADILGHMYGKTVQLDPVGLAHLPWSEQIEVLTQSLAEQGIIRPGTDSSEIRGFVEVYKTQAQIRYVPAPEPRIKLALFRAETMMAEFLEGMPESLREDESWGWRAYAAGEPRVLYTPGDHLTMVTQPHVQQLARQLHGLFS